MKITNLVVENYKGLHSAETPISDFVCVVGENNAGKSSLLQALLLFINGTKLKEEEYYDQTKDILITATLEGITEEVLGKLTDDHRKDILPYVKNGILVLARRYSTDGSSKLKLVTPIPREKKFQDESIDDAFKGKKGKDIADVLTRFYPEVADEGEALKANTQKAAKELIKNYVSKLDPEKLMLSDIPLPTGIDNSIRSILPEPVYIPAVKDLSDDLKTKESASFGKLLNILLDVIEEDLSEAKETFDLLRRKLNRIANDDGSVTDDRMDRVKSIEDTIQKNLQETFRNVSIELKIPPPEIKTVLSNASIIADDGVSGSIDHKGDGFKRAITFSILRSYVQLSQDEDWRKETDQGKPTREKFIFLFEEPELYLHPRAQNILFDALSLISESHQVLVTTHSPLFFSSDETTTFIKIAKHEKAGLPKPVGQCVAIDLTDMSEKDKFQLISFETSNLAFFSRRIVLVEGDSEFIVFPHIASHLNHRWDFKTSSISLVRINGKGSFKRYKEFFNRFGVEVFLVADLDVLLEGFDKIEPSDEAKKIREELFVDIDKIIDDANLLTPPPPKLLKRELQRERANALYKKIMEARDENDVDRQIELLNELFVFERSRPRLEVLRDEQYGDAILKKRQLLAKMRESGVFVLEKGVIEDYYPADVTGGDKPSKAQSFCSVISDRDAIIGLSNQIEDGDGVRSELEVIFSEIFAA